MAVFLGTNLAAVKNFGEFEFEFEFEFWFASLKVAAIIVTLVPWDDPKVATVGPFYATLDHLGISGAAEIMNVVILIALLSAMNASIYGASRMACSLVARGQGPKRLGRVTSGVPRTTVLISSVFGFLCVLLSYWRPDDVFPWLLNMIGAVILVVWIFIAVSQLLLRRRLEREAPEKLVVRMWLFPVGTLLALAAMTGIFLLMLRQPGTRDQLLATGALTVVLAVIGVVRQRRVATVKD